MLYFILLGLFLVLLSIIAQDFKNRTIDIFSLILFILLSFGLSVIENSLLNSLKIALPPILFILFQVIILKLVFSMKEKKNTQIIDTKLGLGDIVFWVGLAFHFSLFNFILFFVLSMIFTLLLSFLLKLKTIPLAGGQAIFLMLFLIINQFIVKFNTYDDLYFINLLF